MHVSCTLNLVWAAQSTGARDWSSLAQQMPQRDGRNRSGKSCRLRWCNQLDPSVSKNPFSEWEIAVIILAQKVSQLCCSYALETAGG